MRILVIEDDHLVADLMRQVLVDDGYTVDVAAAAEEGRQLVAAQPYDAIVLDLELPDRHGIQLLQDFRREGSTIPIVVATAHDSNADVVPVNAFQEKPVAPKRLLALVDELLKKGG